MTVDTPLSIQEVAQAHNAAPVVTTLTECEQTEVSGGKRAPAVLPSNCRRSATGMLLCSNPIKHF